MLRRTSTLERLSGKESVKGHWITHRIKEREREKEREGEKEEKREGWGREGREGERGRGG